MAWSYLVVCLFDFIGGPILNALVAYYTDTAYHEWNPLTLRGGGLYHLSMAAIVGIATWSRGNEKQMFLSHFRPEDDHRDDHEQDDEQDKNDTPDPPSDRHKGDDAR